MKKLLLLILSVVGLISVVQSQSIQTDHKKYPDRAPAVVLIEPIASDAPASLPAVIPAPVKAGTGTNYVSQIPIGTSANAIGFFVDGRNANVWVDNRLNTVTFTHRLLSPSGNHIGYDVSFDRGLTWDVDQLNYDPTIEGYSPGRYPLGGIVNPLGNTDPANAAHTYVAPILDGSHGAAGSWGGIAYGAKSFAADATPWQAAFSTTPEKKWFLPDAFNVTQQGDIWFVDEETDWDGSTSTGLGILTVVRGTYDAETSEIENSYISIPLDIEEGRGINDIEIAFAPDGQTGFISVLTSLANPLPYTSYHPVLFKTTDGGDTWDDPIEVQLGGADGLDAIKNFITDERLADYFDIVPPRDEIIYFIGYIHDLTVDAWGNPHIIGNIMLATEDGIYTQQGVNAIFHIWSPDGGETWDAYHITNVMQWKAEFTEGGTTVNHYNRPQVGTTMDGTLIFFSWIDCDLPEADDNTRPDIYFSDFIPYEGENGTHGEVENVTFLSPAMWTANWATMPYYVFSEIVGENTVKATIPWVYQKLDNEYNGSNPVQFFYIPDFSKTYTMTSISELNVSNIASISQNKPNPFTGSTTVDISLIKSAHVSIDIYNLTGQKIKSIDYGKLGSGATPLIISGGGLPTGVYFYTVQADNDKVTRKMIVH